MSRRIRFSHRAASLAAVSLIAALALAAATSHAYSPVLQGGATAALEAPAATGPLLSYQGRLVDPTTGSPKNGPFAMTFKLYGVATGGTALWTETKNVVVSNGLFSALLGDTTALNLAAFDGRDLWLGVQVGSDLEATPRIQVAYAPYALYASNAAKLGGQLPNAFAGAAHQHSAADIASGTLSYAQFSAYGDLQNEGKIGAGGTQVAAGDHLHDGRYFTQGDTNSLFVNDNAGEVDNQDVPDGALSATKITGTASVVGHTHDAGAINSGMLSCARYGAFECLAETGRIGPNSNQVARGDHDHGGAFWSGNWGASGLVVENQGYGDAIRAYSIATGYNWGAIFAVNNSSGAGVYAASNGGNAGYFDGPVYVLGWLTKAGGGFQIDHPLDAQNKTLNHSFVESPDMKNIYDGVITLDAKGAAWVELPAWFEALNQDFRYQLTPIGAPGPNLYIAAEIQDNRFKIAGGAGGMKVSWQVTGIRHDPYAEAHPMAVEQGKPPDQQGTYLYPTEYGQPESAGVGYATLQQKMSDAANNDAGITAQAAPVP